MNILHLRASNFYGGPERQLHLHAKLARNTGYNVTIGSFAEDGDSPEFLHTVAEDGIATHVFPVQSAYDRRSVSLLKEFIKENEIQVLCTHEYRTHLIGLLATIGTDTGWVAFSRGWTMDNFKVRAYHVLDKTIIRFAGHIVAVSHAQKKKLTRLLIPGSRVSVAHNSVTPGAFDPIPPVDLRRRFSFPPDSVVCVSAGRFSREKGQRYFVQAALEALTRNPNLRFVLFGDGPDYAEIVESVKAAGQSEAIQCPGHERNLIGCLKGADILVNPSLSEGLPNIVLEGMAVGVPTIATAVGGVPEMIVSGENGLLVKPADDSALSAAIQSLAADKGLRQKIIHGARQTIKESFSFQQQFADITAVYDRWKVSR